MYPVLIPGSTVMLRELAEADTVALHKAYGNDEATRHLSFEPRSMEQVAAIISDALKSATADPRTEYMVAVADKDEALAGAARLATGEYESATIGFALRPDQWGQGKGRETVRLLQARAGYLRGQREAHARSTAGQQGQPASSSNQVTVRSPRRRHPHRAARPATI